MKTHELKTLPNYYQAVRDGLKTFECRFNDRNFEVGDTVILKEYLPESKTYTGRQMEIKIKYILENFEGLNDGWVVFSW